MAGRTSHATTSSGRAQCSTPWDTLHTWHTLSPGHFRTHFVTWTHWQALTQRDTLRQQDTPVNTGGWNYAKLGPGCVLYLWAKLSETSEKYRTCSKKLVEEERNTTCRQRARYIIYVISSYKCLYTTRSDLLITLIIKRIKHWHIGCIQRRPRSNIGSTLDG